MPMNKSKMKTLEWEPINKAAKSGNVIRLLFDNGAICETAYWVDNAWHFSDIASGEVQRVCDYYEHEAVGWMSSRRNRK